MLPIAAQPTGGSLGELFGRPVSVGGFAAGSSAPACSACCSATAYMASLSGFASVLGLLFQLALIALLGRLIWTWWRADRANTLADLSPRQLGRRLWALAPRSAGRISTRSTEAECGTPGDEILIKRSGAQR